VESFHPGGGRPPQNMVIGDQVSGRFKKETAALVEMFSRCIEGIDRDCGALNFSDHIGRPVTCPGATFRKKQEDENRQGEMYYGLLHAFPITG
jgi:hypothetical protein